ncbi:methylenetetrahydrofolate reductase C-terminal domain-containing protein [bacterium]|nr:methylenetetrahydrofolate reductase C-terminal domain-containing protein [bacterium]
MIIATPKPLDELLRILAPYSWVLVAGCHTCVTIGKVGGEENIKTMISALEMSSTRQDNPFQFEIVRTPRQCEPEMLEMTHGLDSPFNRWDAILSFGCAVGVQALSDFIPGIPVVPALNTRFIGSLSGSAQWESRCVGCGDCFLHLTSGICVLARCPRSMQNSSCGYESETGKCDVNPKRECVWDIIRARHRIVDSSDENSSDYPGNKYITARNWSLSAHGGVTRVPQSALTDSNKEKS